MPADAARVASSVTSTSEPPYGACAPAESHTIAAAATSVPARAQNFRGTARVYLAPPRCQRSDMSPHTQPVNISERVDTSPIGSLQITTFAICLLCLIMDGFDVQALGYVAPEIVRAWRISNAALGPVFGAGNFGVLVGSLVFSMLADRIGRRPILVGATVFFGAMTIVAARTNAVGELLAA